MKKKGELIMIKREMLPCDERENRSEGRKQFRIKTSEISVYSLIKEEKEKDSSGEELSVFYFYKVTKKSMEAVKSGTALYTKTKLSFREGSMDEMLKASRFRAAAMRGILIGGLDGGRMAGFTENGLKMLCTKSGISKNMADRRSNSRDFLIAETIFDKREYVITVINGEYGELLIDGIFGENYKMQETPVEEELCEKINENSQGFMHMTYIGRKDVNGIIDIRFESGGNAFMSNGKRYVPGIRIKDSVSGKCSFTMQATIRMEKTENYIIVAEKKMRHDSGTGPIDVCGEWAADMKQIMTSYILTAGVMDAWIDEMKKKKEYFERTEMPKVVGKKRAADWKRACSEKPGSAGDYVFHMQDCAESDRSLREEQKEKLRKIMGRMLL